MENYNYWRELDNSLNNSCYLQEKEANDQNKGIQRRSHTRREVFPAGASNGSSALRLSVPAFFLNRINSKVSDIHFANDEWSRYIEFYS